MKGKAPNSEFSSCCTRAPRRELLIMTICRFVAAAVRAQNSPAGATPSIKDKLFRGPILTIGKNQVGRYVLVQAHICGAPVTWL